jgi:RNA recognition motif-containing protein
MPSSLYLVNLPHNCTDKELKDWIESRGFQTSAIRIIHDVISGVSPAFGYVRLNDDSQIEEACTALTGRKLRTLSVLVSRAEERRAISSIGTRLSA